MQTRKRAKSVTFGKKEKKEEVEKPVGHESVVVATDKVSEKAEVVGRRTVPEKTLPDELSATPPKSDEIVETPEIATPSNEFVTDTEASPIEAPKVTSGEPVSINENSQTPSLAAKKVEQPEAEAVDTTLQPSLSPEKPQAKTEVSQELSQTPPQSAFTIQNNEAISSDGGGKKRFGIYFVVVAFLSFILGLGAMAGVTYFGKINITLLKVPSGLHVPAFLGAKPSPTVAIAVVPTVAPTEKPVDLHAYAISVLNGSGVAGKAAEVKTSLTTAGFKVSTTGNADKNDYTKTQITAKKTVDHAFVNKLQDELKKTFVVEVSTSASSDQADVTVILGKDTAK